MDWSFNRVTVKSGCALSGKQIGEITNIRIRRMGIEWLTLRWNSVPPYIDVERGRQVDIYSYMKITVVVMTKIIKKKRKEKKITRAT